MTPGRRGFSLPTLAVVALLLATAGILTYLFAVNSPAEDGSVDTAAQASRSLGTGTGAELPADWSCEEFENKAFALRGSRTPSWDGTYTFRCQDDGNGGREPVNRQQFYSWSDGRVAGGPWEKAF